MCQVVALTSDAEGKPTLATYVLLCLLDEQAPLSLLGDSISVELADGVPISHFDSSTEDRFSCYWETVQAVPRRPFRRIPADTVFSRNTKWRGQSILLCLAMTQHLHPLAEQVAARCTSMK